jgi:hypothetical protein
MEGGATERDALLREQMKVMSPERFEQLVLALAQREFPDVRRLKHPDGGADVLRPATDERKAEVWQAKRYPKNINWKECEDSLRTAIERWEPSKVTFVFPRDLSQQREKSFTNRLVKHKAATKAGVEVQLWNESELARRLDEHPELRVRFFGKPQEDVVAAMDRAIRAGGKLESGADLVERARTLSEYAEQRDIDFTYNVMSSSAEAPEPDWPELPYLKMQITGPGGRVDVVTWAREGADVLLPRFSFSDDAAGAGARAEAVKAWARGDEAVVQEGAHLQFHVPEVIKELLPATDQLTGGSVRIPASPPFEAELEVETPDGTVSHRFQVRPVPPGPGEFGALVGYIGNTLVDVSFALLDETHSRARFSLSTHFSLDARANLEAARLLHAWCTNQRLSFRSDEVYPDGIGGRGDGGPDSDVCAEAEWRARFYADIVFLEDTLGVELPLPEQMTVEDLNVAGTAVQILRSGEGTATFRQAEIVVQNPADIPRLPDDARKEGAARRMVTYPLFGRELQLGVADYEMPPLKVVNIFPHGDTPKAPARVVLAAEGDDQMRFRLVGWEPPAEPES